MSLSKLLAELRNAIFELSLPHTIELSAAGNATTPALLQLNKQIRAEATSLYQPVEITAHITENQLYGPLSWLAARPRAAAQAVTSLHLQFSASDAFIANLSPIVGKYGTAEWVASEFMRAWQELQETRNQAFLKVAGVDARAIQLKIPMRDR